MKARQLIVAALLMGAAQPAFADVIKEKLTGGFSTTGNAFLLGQSITMPAGGPWNEITFSLESNSGPVAGGDLFLLTSSYAGLPTGLSASTPGYVADTSVVSGGAWDFSGVTLNPNTQYFFYTATWTIGQNVMFGFSDPAVGGIAYQANNTASAYAGVSSVDLEFVLSGTPVATAVPEPASLALLAAGLAGAGVVRRRKR